MEQLTERLRLLQAWSGLSYRTIHREVVRARAARGVPEQPVLNTVYRCFQPGRTRLDVELVVDIARVLLGDDAAEQWRQACWVVAGQESAASIVSVADTWPDDLPSFTGRETELQEILGPTNGQHLAITGMPGIGKTRLAVHAGHVLMAQGKFRALRLAVDLRGYDPDRPPADPGAVLDGFLRRLGVSGEQVQHLSLASRVAKYRQSLTGKNALLLLDNAASSDQVRPLLPDSPGCLALITSRRRLTDLPTVRQLPLDVLSPEDAVQLLRHATSGRFDAEPDMAARIAAVLGHLPLALELVARHIRANDDWTLSDHLDRLLHHRHSLRVDDGVEAAIQLSYRDLPADRRKAFRLLSLHPGGDITPDAAAALIGTDPESGRRYLEQLTSASLLQCLASDWYRFHDLIRVYASHRAHEEDPSAARRAAVTRLSDYYLNAVRAAMDVAYPHVMRARPSDFASVPATVSLVDRAAARSWLDNESANLLAVATHPAQDDAAVVAFSEMLHRHLATVGRYRDAEILDRHAATVLRAMGDFVGEANALINLAELSLRTGRYEQVIDDAQRALVLSDDFGRWEGEGRAWFYLGFANQQTGHYERAADHYQRAVERFRQFGNRVGEASALGNLGALYELTGPYDRAAEYHQQVLALFRGLGDREGEARALDHLGVLHQLRGRYGRAAAHHRQALTLLREVGDREGQATALDHLGVVDQLTGRYERAADHHQRALKLSRAIGDRDDEARALNHLGTLCRRTGRDEQAVDHHRHALSVYRELGDPTGQARSLNGLGEAERVSGDLPSALTAHAEAHQHASKIGLRQEQARADDGLGHVHRDLGDVDQAREHWQRALSVYEELGVPEAEAVRARLAALG